MLDGVKAVVASGKNTTEILAELSKEAGTPGFYLETDRAYRSEHDVFDDYTEQERDRLFGKPPATVWENMNNLKKFAGKTEVIKKGNILRQEIINAFVSGALVRWSTELLKRIIPENLGIVKAAKPLHDMNTAVDYDLYLWDKINALRFELAKDTIDQKSIFTRIKNAILSDDHYTASALQIEMYSKVEQLKELYSQYKKNII